MGRSRFADKQIIAIVKAQEAGMAKGRPMLELFSPNACAKYPEDAGYARA